MLRWLELPQGAGREWTSFLHDLLPVVEETPALMTQLAESHYLRHVVFPERARFTVGRGWNRRTVSGSFLCRVLSYDLGILEEVWDEGVYRQAVERLRPGDTVLDAGAHGGFFAVLAAKLVGPRGHVVAVEPEPSNVALLREHLRRNSIRTVTVAPQALGRRAGTVTLHLSSGTSGHSVHTKRSRVTRRVLQTTVDALAKKLHLKKIHLLKIDAEAAELDILRGARETLPLIEHIVAACYHTPTEAASVRKFLRRARFRASVTRGIVSARSMSS